MRIKNVFTCNTYLLGKGGHERYQTLLGTRDLLKQGFGGFTTNFIKVSSSKIDLCLDNLSEGMHIA